VCLEQRQQETFLANDNPEPILSRLRALKDFSTVQDDTGEVNKSRAQQLFRTSGTIVGNVI